MLPSEAQWIGARLAELDAHSISPVLELGSSTQEFRRFAQPHIYQWIDQPLINRGVSIVYCDSKSGSGIDISGNIFDAAIQNRIRSVQPNCLLCCNIFEHVTDRAEFASICDSLLVPGACLLVTVPYSYPLHFDPIDTYFRPTPGEVHQLFPNYELLASDIVASGSYSKELLSNMEALPVKLKAIVKSLIRPTRPRNWVIMNHRLLWVFRRYKVSAVLLRKKNYASEGPVSPASRATRESH